MTTGPLPLAGTRLPISLAHHFPRFRYDHRPFLYNTRWTWQFAKIDALVKQLEALDASKQASHDTTSQTLANNSDEDLKKKLADAEAQVKKLQAELAARAK
jgi:hypothetical protein